MVDACLLAIDATISVRPQFDKKQDPSPDHAATKPIDMFIKYGKNYVV